MHSIFKGWPQQILTGENMCNMYAHIFYLIKIKKTSTSACNYIKEHAFRNQIFNSEWVICTQTYIVATSHCFKITVAHFTQFATPRQYKQYWISSYVDKCTLNNKPQRPTIENTTLYSKFLFNAINIIPDIWVKESESESRMFSKINGYRWT